MWSITKILHSSMKHYWIHVAKYDGNNMWECNTRFSTIAIELGMALKSPYINCERPRFSTSFSKSNSWFSFGSSSKYSSLLLSISTNEATYVMVVFECGNNYWKIPIDVFIVNLTLWNALEIGIDNYHRSGWLGESKATHNFRRHACGLFETKFLMSLGVVLVS